MSRPLERKLISNTMIVLVLACALHAAALEPRLRGGKGTLRLTGETGRYHLLEPGAPLTFTIKGSGNVELKMHAVLGPGGSGPLGTLHIAVDGAETGTSSATAGAGSHFIGRRDLVAGPALDQEVKIAEGSHTVVLSADNGPLAISVDWQSDAARLLLATPLVGEQALTAAPLTGTPPPTNEAAKEPALKPPPVVVEPMVPLTVDAVPPRHAAWPFVFLTGALVTGFAGAVVWGVAANTDSSYNNTPEGPSRNAKLSTANNELHASMVLAGVAIGLAATGTVGLIFQ